MSWICYIGIKKSSSINSFMVYLKVGVIVIFVLAGMHYVDTSNWHPYIPENTGEKGHYGWSGIMTGAAPHPVLVYRLRHRIDHRAGIA